jgi:hypothetical protein
VQYIEFHDVTTRLAGKLSLKENTLVSISATSPASSSEPATELPLMPLIPNPAWDEQSIFISHLVDNLFVWHEDPASPQSVSWISVLLRYSDDQAVLSFTTIRALATAYFAKVYGSSELMRKGAWFYSRALGALRAQLQDPKLVLEEDVLVSIICMGVYELLAFTQPTGWLNHYKGLARLVSVLLHRSLPTLTLRLDCHERAL